MTYYGPANEMDRAYYLKGGIEAIEVVEAWELGYCLGCVVKYIARCGVKTPDRLEDLKKARWYLDREIARLAQPVAASAPPPPAPMASFSNAGMDAARRQMQGSDFRFGQSVANEAAQSQTIPPPFGGPPETAGNHEINLGPGPHISCPY